MGKIIELDVNDINFWLDNPRFQKCKNEDEMKNKLSDTKGFSSLLESINKFGFQESNLVTVSDDANNKGRYIVFDGNRRLAAIKKIPSIKKINVYYENDKEAIRAILKREHMNDPAGRLRWTSVQQARQQQSEFRQKIIPEQLISAQCLEVLEKAVGELNTDFPLTTFERIFTHSYEVKTFSNDLLEKIHKDISDKKINSRNINTGENIEIYLKSLKKGRGQDERTKLSEDNESEEQIEEAEEESPTRLLRKEEVKGLKKHVGKEFVKELEQCPIARYPNLLTLASRAILDTLHNVAEGLNINKRPGSLGSNDLSKYIPEEKSQKIRFQNLKKYIEELCEFAHCVNRVKTVVHINNNEKYLNTLIHAVTKSIEKNKPAK